MGAKPHLKGGLGGKTHHFRLFLCLYKLAASERQTSLNLFFFCKFIYSCAVWSGLLSYLELRPHREINIKRFYII